MHKSHSKILLHIIFATQNCRPAILPVHAARLHTFLASACHDLESEVFRIGGTADHVHIACTLPRTLTVCALVQEVKRSSSVWMKTLGEANRHFCWQHGYGAFSFGFSQLEQVRHYIENQAEHHKHQDFKEEMEELLNLYQVTYDSPHLWDS